MRPTFVDQPRKNRLHLNEESMHKVSTPSVLQTSANTLLPLLFSYLNSETPKQQSSQQQPQPALVAYKGKSLEQQRKQKHQRTYCRRTGRASHSRSPNLPSSRILVKYLLRRISVKSEDSRRAGETTVPTEPEGERVPSIAAHLEQKAPTRIRHPPGP